MNDHEELYETDVEQTQGQSEEAPLEKPLLKRRTYQKEKVVEVPVDHPKIKKVIEVSHHLGHTMKAKKERTQAQIEAFEKVLERNRERREAHKGIKQDESTEKEVKHLKHLEDNGLIEIRVKPKVAKKTSENHPFTVVKREVEKTTLPDPIARVVAPPVVVKKPGIYDNLFGRK